MNCLRHTTKTKKILFPQMGLGDVFGTPIQNISQWRNKFVVELVPGAVFPAAVSVVAKAV